MALSFGNQASNLCDTSEIYFSKCKCDSELVYISSKFIALLECNRRKTKNSKDLEESVLKKNFNHTSRYWGWVGKFRFMIQKGMNQYEYMNSGKKFEETQLPPKNAVHNKLKMKCISDND